MSREADKIVSDELTADEQLLWSGRPRAGIRLTSGDAFIIPFSVAWCGFALLWEERALKMNGPPFFAVWGLMFVVAGLYFVFGRFIADAFRRGKTFYGLTAHRAIIVSGVFSRHVRTVDLASLGEISMSERADGSGTICFGVAASTNARAVAMLGPSWPGAARYLPPAFEMIEDVRSVYAKIRGARQVSGG